MLSVIWILVIPCLMHVTESRQCINQKVKCVCSNPTIKRLEVEIGLRHLLEKGKCNKTERPIDCEDVYNHGYRSNGVYMIYPDGETGFDVYCDMKTDGGGWTVIQRRYNGKTDFYRTWMEYKRGFGDKNKEYWLGNDKIHLLTKMYSYRLRVDLEDFKGVSKYASYSKFYVGSKNTYYVLTVSGYSGTVGDRLTYHNGQKFSTKDHDNDIYKGNCAESHKGNDKIHLLTKMHSYRLRVDLEDFKGVSKYASYSKFYVGGKNKDYVLTVGGYSGTVGDSLTPHNGQKFSTKDQDNDSYKGHCADLWKGAWWYKYW